MNAFQNPKNVGEVENYDGIGTVGNASCGDIMQITMLIEDGIIKDAEAQIQELEQQLFSKEEFRKHMDTIPAEYRFVKNQKVALFFGYWCMFVTAACCILGMYSTDTFTMILNIVTPCVLAALGMIMPYLAKKEREKLAAK